MREVTIQVCEELCGPWVRDGDILNDVFRGETRLMKRVVHDACVHVVVKDESCDGVEWCEEILVCISSYPEATAIIYVVSAHNNGQNSEENERQAS